MAANTVDFKIKVDGKEIDLAKVSVNDFKKAYTDAQNKLDTLPLGSEEWKKLNQDIKNADKSFQQTKEILSETEGQFKSLKVQIRQATIAFQEAESKGDLKGMEMAKKQLDDLNDQFELTTLKSMKFTDALATMPGIAGFVGQSIQGVDKAFKVLVANPILAVITAVVGAFTLLKEALGKTSEGQEALNKVQSAFSKILGPLLALINTVAVPIFEGLAMVIEKVGGAFAWFAEKLGVSKESIAQATKDVDKVGQEAAENEKKRQEEAAKKAEEEAQKKKEAADKAKQAAAEEKRRKQDAINDNEALRQSEDELRRSKMATIEDPIEAKKQEQAQADEDFKREKKRIEDLMKVQGTTAEERKRLQTELNNLETQYNNDKKARDKEIIDAEKEKKEKQEEIAKSILEVDKAIADQRLAAQKDGIVKEINEIKKSGQDKIDAYKEQLKEIVKQQGLTQEEAAKKLKEFTDLVTTEVGNATKQALGEDFLNNLDKGLNDFFSKTDNSYAKVVETIDAANVKLKDAYAKGLINEEEYTMRSIALNNNLKDAKQRNVDATMMLSDAAGQAAQAIGEETAAGIVLIKVQQLAALAATGQALAESFKGLGKDIGKGFPTNVIAVASTLALIATAISQFKSLLGKSPKDLGKGGGEMSTSGGQNLGRNYADGGMINGPRHAQGGVMIEAEGGEAIMTRGAVTMFAPLLSAMNQMGGGTSFGNQLYIRPDAPVLEKPQQAQEPMIMKTYVVSNELTSQAEKQARLKDLSTL